MKTLDKGQDKIQKICDALRSEALQPAREQADQILEEAHRQAEQLIAEAKEASAKMMADAHQAIVQQRNVFSSSLEQAAKQTLELLKQNVEQKLFHEGLDRLLEEKMADPMLIARLVDAMVVALEKEGLSTDFLAIIPKKIGAQEIVCLLLQEVVELLRMGPLPIGDFSGGAQIKLNDKKLTLDISDRALSELLKSYVRKDFRKLIFAHQTPEK